ncbi:hypothetical protein EVAR_26401_1 [Eumeta japonica]|uniref:Uncharacterized protein n=1 Tax=Eumeta variegata TaxID=151549 RepID=A0A4C1VNR4_EUMVA|nr:hypothetical protein EVAR_26401_1 [Eumeta japonica]
MTYRIGLVKLDLAELRAWFFMTPDNFVTAMSSFKIRTFGIHANDKYLLAACVVAELITRDAPTRRSAPLKAAARPRPRVLPIKFSAYVHFGALRSGSL